MTLNTEDKALKQELMDGIRPDPVDVWPAVSAAIHRRPDRVRHGLPRRVLIPMIALVALICLMGAGYLNHWYVFDSDGSKTELAENEGYAQKDGAVIMQLYKENGSEGIFNPYDWTENADYPLGGIPLAGNPSAALIQEAEAGQLVETWDHELPFTQVMGAYTTDYAEFQRMVENNVLHFSLPDEETLPASYDQHTLFQAGYYLTPEDLPDARALSSETANGLKTTVYALPDKVQEQVGHVELYWFNEEKEGLLFAINLADSTEMLFTADESEEATIHPITVEGFEKAVLYECYNEYYGKTERLVFLWKAAGPLETMAMGYNATVQIAESTTRSYVMYSLDAVGLREDEILSIVNGL